MQLQRIGTASLMGVLVAFVFFITPVRAAETDSGMTTVQGGTAEHPHESGDMRKLEDNLELVFVGQGSDIKRIQLHNTGTPVKVMIFDHVYPLATNDWTELNPPNINDFTIKVAAWEPNDAYLPPLRADFSKLYVVKNLPSQKNIEVKY
jgi:hypothetical protein